MRHLSYPDYMVGEKLGHTFRFSIRSVFQVSLLSLLFVLTTDAVRKTTHLEQKLRELLLTKSQVKLGKRLTCKDELIHPIFSSS